SIASKRPWRSAHTANDPQGRRRSWAATARATWRRRRPRARSKRSGLTWWVLSRVDAGLFGLCAAQNYEAEACRLPHTALALDIALPDGPRAVLGTTTACTAGIMRTASGAPSRP